MLHHVEINVNDLRKTRSFYDVLLPEMGYSLYQEWELGFSYKFDNTYLVFVQTIEKHLESTYHRGQTGLNHLAFHAKSREQVDEITKMLEVQGTKILYKDKHPYASGNNVYAVFFEDPDRIKLEIVAPE
ncbi:VOC family protein [Paenisporosarcina sp. TG20]|uniref:VOC family protein n=1 Tax=Paenisporosarcina sp. TG20 TaxID=1211706 RepID=UPI0002F11B0A|nr:VOC family protein [Paenisporosarcina sp. TG20]